MQWLAMRNSKRTYVAYTCVPQTIEYVAEQALGGDDSSTFSNIIAYLGGRIFAAEDVGRLFYFPTSLTQAPPLFWSILSVIYWKRSLQFFPSRKRGDIIL